MRFKVTRARVVSLRDFGREYLMIVLSILTALGLQAWVEHADHQQAAQTASAQIEAEIHENLAQIRQMRAHDLTRMHALEAVRDGLLHDTQAHLPDATTMQHAQARMPEGLYLDYRWPVMSHQAWDVAVANASAGWIDSDRLRRYSAVYALQNASTATMAADLPMVLDGPRMNDAMMDLQAGTVSPRDLLHVVNQMASAVNEAAHNLDNLERHIQDVMAADSKPLR